MGCKTANSGQSPSNPLIPYLLVIKSLGLEVGFMVQGQESVQIVDFGFRL